jgi:hypothetical protein
MEFATENKLVSSTNKRGRGVILMVPRLIMIMSWHDGELKAEIS